MIWTLFPYFAISALVLWLGSAAAAWKGRTALTFICSITGLAAYFSYILLMWCTLERPPMRTMGETRLWYVFFISLSGIIVYSRWRYRWIMTFSAIMATVFTFVNLLKPEIHDKVLMPALQSPWFAPHVTVYMFAYGLFGAAAVMAVYLLWFRKSPATAREMALCDNLTGVGLSFMTVGMLLGAVWAEQAWGHYWTWDPKETWAAITWLTYLVYIHLRIGVKGRPEDEERNTSALFILIFAFVFLQICWYGINWLPSARGASVHIYG